MSLTPWLRSPFSDLTANMGTHQWHGRCADFEMKVMECLESYGLERGLRECDALIKDFNECHSGFMHQERHMAMRKERDRQYRAGERKEHYAESPKMDAW